MTPLVQALIPTFIGLVFIIGTYLQMRNAVKLIKDGVSVEGIVFGFESSSSEGMYPIIRFVTKEGVWITKTYHTSLPRFIIKEGKKLQILYDPNNPEEFAINSNVFKWTNYLFLFVGFLLFVFGVYQLVQLF